ncbi:MAG: RNA polymerase Rpb4 [Thaumarchaeota archaeon]|nr:RNA polymerase Rpb4 [Nitrososphaerota archaeon]MCL5318209.1 RNA polymerase Rpb4 [Nitrososphaerota archaeon]
MSATKEKKLITLPEVKKLLQGLNEETADQIQRRTLDYVSKFSKVSAEESEKIRERLVSEAKLSEREAVEITNIMPKSKEELRVFTSGWKKLLPEDAMDKILEILNI